MAESEDIKPADEQITISIRVEGSNATKMKIKRGTKCGKIFDAYLKSKGISGVKFLFNGEEVNRDDSPEDLNINDGDELEAIMMQTGGC